MRRLQIGMWEQFSPERWEQLAMPLINGMEYAVCRTAPLCHRFGISAVSTGSDTESMDRCLRKTGTACLC